MRLNVLVVEDEEYVRKSIVYKVDWESLGFNPVKEAENAYQALEIIAKEDIDLIITDIKMPGMNGLELIEKVKEEYDNKRFVIVSGYSEFEYAKKALLYNVSEYILKPVKGAELERILSRIMMEILEEKDDALYRENIEKSHKENTELIKNYYLIKLLQQEPGKEELELYLKKLSPDFGNKRFVVSILRVILSHTTDKKEGGAKNNTGNIIKRLGEIYADEHIRIYNNLKYSYEWIIIDNYKKEEDSRLKSKHQAAIKSINDEFGINCIIGVGTEVKVLENLGESYAKAEFAVKEAILKGINKIIDYQPHENVLNLNWLNVNQEEVIVKYLDNMNTAGLKEHVKVTFEGLSHWEQINHKTYFNLALDLFVTLKKYIQRNSDIVTKSNEFEPEFLNDLTKCSTLDGVIRWCETCINWFESLMSENYNKSGKELVISIRQYIINNYGSDISLNYIADKYSISPNHLCKLFKLYTNETFKAFITKIRMEKAIELIINSEFKLSSISELVGYEDPKYFSKVFKSYFGFPPSQFKENS